MNSLAPLASALLLAATHALLAPAFGATLMCRWMDENGRTHITDIVPEKYTNMAICTDSDQYELTADQLRDAAQRQATQRSKTLREQATQDVSSESRRVETTPPPRVKRPAEIVTNKTDCPTWWRLYDESSACFGPFNTVRGIKAEAYDVCNEVASPEPKCGLRSN